MKDAVWSFEQLRSRWTCTRVTYGNDGKQVINSESLGYIGGHFDSDGSPVFVAVNFGRNTKGSFRSLTEAMSEVIA